ncbi:MAG: acyl-CoA thioesterase [Bacteroidetes bacterium]|nr:MAG: acyl-CoA thioesterase [Bacteroidota bacterium]
MENKFDLTPHSFDKIRFYDCDPFGHLNNSRFLDYIMNAREIHLAQFYDFHLEQFYSQGWGWVVSSHEILYLRPAQFNETVCIQTSLIDATDSALTVEGIMYDQHKSSMKALLWTKFTSVDLKTGKRQPHTSEMNEFVKNLLNKEVDVDSGITRRVKSLNQKKPA